jgi:peptidoglycan-N-acetylglucosamine deacetylase
MLKRMLGSAVLFSLLSSCDTDPLLEEPQVVHPLLPAAQATVPAPVTTTAAVSTLTEPVLTSAATLPEPAAVPVSLQVEAPAASHYNIREHIIYSGSRQSKKVALTFDDGPDAKYTNQILDILHEHEVKATFFVVGEHAAFYKNTMKRIVDQGHEVGNHSWSHVDLTKLDENRLQEEINKTDEVIQGYTGKPVPAFRPPYGAVSKMVVDYAEKHHKIICWSVDTRDWEGIPSDQIVQHVKRDLRNGGIILQHSAGGKHGNLSNTVKALPALIQYLKENGYELVTVSEL